MAILQGKNTTPRTCSIPYFPAFFLSRRSGVLPVFKFMTKISSSQISKEIDRLQVGPGIRTN